MDAGGGQGLDVGLFRPSRSRLSLHLPRNARHLPARSRATAGVRAAHGLSRQAPEARGAAHPEQGKKGWTMTKRTGLMAALLVVMAAGCATTASFTDPRRAGAAVGGAGGDPGCTSTTLVSTGGPFPRDARTLVLRWTGFANFEMVYNGQVVLLDAYI